MPLYEYLCEACGKRFERIQKYSDPVVDTCPACSGVANRLLSSPAIQFKGSGWYITDYAKKAPASAGGDGEKSTPASEAGGGGDKASASGDAKKGDTKSSGGSGGAEASGSGAGSGSSSGSGGAGSSAESSSSS